MLDWRTDFNHNSELRQAVENRVLLHLEGAREHGDTVYGPDFVGDPLEQAFEEAMDLAFYLATEIERRQTDA